MQDGLMQRTTPTNDLLSQMRKMLATRNGPQSLAQKVEGLSAQQQEQVMRFASLIRAGMKMQRKAVSWATLTDKLYPNLDVDLKAIIADLLQESDPVELVGLHRDDTREQAQTEYLASLSSLDEPIIKPSTKSEEDRDAELMQYLLNAAIKDVNGDEGSAAPVSTTVNDNKAFLDRLAMSESSGNPNATITIKDGRSFTGKYQFGEARLSDYQKATKEKFSTADFKQDEALQDKVAAWHFSDISSEIDKLGEKAKGYDRDGLKAVAHLGGLGSMKNFVRSKGEYNPSDELGTSLQDYYDKFVSS